MTNLHFTVLNVLKCAFNILVWDIMLYVMYYVFLYLVSVSTVGVPDRICLSCCKLPTEIMRVCYSNVLLPITTVQCDWKSIINKQTNKQNSVL